jgi:hypothetical protein
MKKVIMGVLVVISALMLGAEKKKAEEPIPDIEVQMEKADKIENYRSKRENAWHKTEYNKVLKYLKRKK